MDSDGSTTGDTRESLANVFLSQYLTDLTDEELSKALQNRRIQVEANRLRGYLANETCPIKSLDSSRMEILDATSSGGLNIKAERSKAVDDNFLRCYRIGENILEIGGRQRSIDALWYYSGEEWDCRMQITYRGKAAALWDKGCEGEFMLRSWEEYGADSDAFKEIFGMLLVDLDLKEPQADVFKGFMAMFWCTELCTRLREVWDGTGKRVGNARRIFLWELALGIENEEQCKWAR